MKLKIAPSLSSTGKDGKRHHKDEAYASLNLKGGAKLHAAENIKLKRHLKRHSRLENTSQKCDSDDKDFSGG